MRLEQSKSSYYATSAAQDTCHLIVGSTIPKFIITVVKRSFFSIEGLKQDFSCKPGKLVLCADRELCNWSNCRLTNSVGPTAITAIRRRGCSLPSHHDDRRSPAKTLEDTSEASRFTIFLSKANYLHTTLH